MTQAELRENFERVWNDCDGCCLVGSIAFTLADVTEILAFEEYPYGGGPDSNSTSLVKLANGKIGVFCEWEDYTGHGCQCGCTTEIYDTVEAALRFGVTDTERTAIEQQVTDLNRA